MPILFADKLCLDSTVTLRACAGAEPPLPTDWFDRANTFVSSNGEKPGRGWILLARNSLDEISLTADHELTFFSSPGQVQTLKKITMIGSANLTPGVTEEARAAFLCEVVDRRYHLSRIPCNVAYNVRSASTGNLLDESLNASVAWTWEEVVEDLWNMLGLGTVPDLPFTPDGDPENLAYWGGWAWAALNDVLDRIGCTVRYWAEEDEFTFVRLGEDDATSDAEADRLDSTGMRTWDSEPFDPVRAWRPQKVRVRFQRSPLPTDGSSPYFTEDVTLTATTGVVSGSYVQLDDDLAALGATGTPTNSADLTTRAAERAADWLRKRRYSDRPQLIVYRDIQPNAGALLGSVRGTLALEDRIGARTSTKSEPDGAMEKWKPLTGVPKWWPPGDGGASYCCPSTEPTSYPLECPPGSGSGSGSGSEGVPTWLDFCGCGGYTTTSSEDLATAGGYTSIDTIIIGACDYDGIGGYDPVPFAGDGGTPCAGLHSTADLPDGALGFPVPRRMCADLGRGGNTGAFATFGDGLTTVSNIESGYNFSGSNSGWTINYYSEDGTFRLAGVFRPCPGGVPGFYFVGYVYSANVDATNPDGYPCGCYTRFPACPPQEAPAPYQEVHTFNPVGLVFRTRIYTPCGSFSIQLRECEPDYVYCCDIAPGTVLGLTIPDGPNAGLYKPVNAVGDYELANGNPVVLTCEGGVYTLGNKEETVNSVTVACGPPIAIAFPAAFGSTTAVTIAPWPY